MIAQRLETELSSSSMQELIEDIMTNHHDYMVREMQRMRYMLRELAEFHAATDHRAFELWKSFEHFTRDFIQHMETEESLLFPWILAETGHNQIIETIEINDSTLEQLNTEDKVVSKEFSFIIERARALSITSGKLSRDYKCAFDRLCQIQENLKIHIKKEHEYILPFIERRLCTLRDKRNWKLFRE